MKYIISILFVAISTSALHIPSDIPEHTWSKLKLKHCTIYFKDSDLPHIQDYKTLLIEGMEIIQHFFNDTFLSEFDLFIHPDRSSLDSAWQQEWSLPGFKSECWMVASGVSNRMDLLSPARWEEEACEHEYTEREKTRNLLAHELFHVYHGQQNKSPDFSDVSGIDWFIEGLASYGSGQCDKDRMEAVRKAVLAEQIPDSLDSFWEGNIRYGLAGSMVLYIDKCYGRNTLKKLLQYNQRAEILFHLNISESQLINRWKDYITELYPAA